MVKSCNDCGYCKTTAKDAFNNFANDHAGCSGSLKTAPIVAVHWTLKLMFQDMSLKSSLQARMKVLRYIN